MDTATPVGKHESKWITITTVMLYITVIWNVFEGGSSIYFGYNTNDISLFAFGIDSWIEVLSASLVLYHMTCTSLPSLSLTNNINTNRSSLFTLEIERKLTIFIGSLLILFCIFSCVGGAFRLLQHIPPSSTTFGIIIGGICIFAMFIMWYYKTKASIILNSSTLASDAACSLGCVTLSAMLCIGSILYQLWPNLWWVDAVTVILIGLTVGYEGFKTVKHARDREAFKGGCGCCGGGGAGAANSGLAKYFNLGTQQTDKVNTNNNNTIRTIDIENQRDSERKPMKSGNKSCNDGCCGEINNGNGCKDSNNNDKKDDDDCGEGCCDNCMNGGCDGCIGGRCNDECREGCCDIYKINHKHKNKNNKNKNSIDECFNDCCTETQSLAAFVSYGAVNNNNDSLKMNDGCCGGKNNGDCCSRD